MQIIPFVAFFALITLLLSTILLVVYHIVRSYHYGAWFRRLLGIELSQLPLHDQLTRLGIEPLRYLRFTSARRIRDHMQACQDCAAHDTCDPFADAQRPMQPIDCPNQISLEQVRIQLDR